MEVIVENRGRGLGPSPDARGTRIAMSFAPASIEAA